MEITFKDLRVGDDFRFSRNLESGVLIDLGKPGRRVYRKTGPRSWELIGAVDQSGSVGSTDARVWKA